MTMRLTIIFFIAIIGVISLSGVSVFAKNNLQRKIKISNDSLGKFDVYWVHPQTGGKVNMNDASISKGAVYTLDSFVGHTFELDEVPNAKSGSCRASNDGICKSVQFTVSDNDDQLATVTKDFEVVFEDNIIKAQMQASELLSSCEAIAKADLKAAGKDTAASTAALEKMVQCVQSGVAGTLERVNEEIAFQASVRRDIAAQLENYTCMDDTMESSDELFSEVWLSEKDHKERTVHVMHNRSASRIHVIDDFINPDECEAMETSAAPLLHHATVADGSGGSRLSDNRKAMQAGITVPWHKEAIDDPITRISRRVYDYTNHVLGLDIDEFGQEDLMSIQYFGRGKTDEAPDRYTPHCDGDCTGLPHKSGTRMATMVLYCDVADLGGHTNFRNAGVHVKPKRGSGIFFSYIDPESLHMDTGFTEHSGCPVFEGQKKIVTQWVRLGVDSENPWNSFNTLGIKIKDMNREEEEEEEEEDLEKLLAEADYEMDAMLDSEL